MKPLMKPKRSPSRAPYGVLALAFLAGCSSSPPPRMLPPDPQVQHFAGKGYMSEEQFSINTVPLSWVNGDHSFDVMLSVPVRAAKYPLVIYLPGLGEPRTAGEGWRNAWAQAGYAVLSVQLLGADADAWQSRAARNGDFKGVVRERYHPVAVAERQAALMALFDTLKRRAAQGDETLRNVDLSRIALAGYDLGAYAAMVGAGERYVKERPVSALPVAAVIALSPHAGFSGPGFDERYTGLNLPVLSITGNGDVDSYGVVTSSSVRTAPFQHMPGGAKYLLMLDDVRHELFGGGPQIIVREKEIKIDDDKMFDRADRGERGPQGPGGRRRNGPSEDVDGGGRNGGIPNSQWGYGQSVVRSVTTAFLDTHLKNDTFSREWLSRDARRWLRDTAELTVK